MVDDVGGLGRGLLAYVRPTFMVPAVATSFFGGLLAGEFALAPGVRHATAVGLALYVAHLRDGYVDGYLRDEEAPHLPARTIRLALRVTSFAFFVLLASIWWSDGPVAALAAGLLWVLGVLHAPYLDTNPVAITLDYPAGIGLVLVGGFLVQSGGVPSRIVAIALLFVVLLAGVKVSIDRLDSEFDGSIGKRTVPVVLGDERATVVASLLFLLSSILLAVFVGIELLPPVALVAGVFPAFAAVAGPVVSPRTGARVGMGLTYPFALVLFVACRPGIVAG